MSYLRIRLRTDSSFFPAWSGLRSVGLDWNKLWLFGELCLIYLALPLLIYYKILDLYFVPVLLFMALGALVWLRRQDDFLWHHLLHLRALRTQLWPIVRLFAPVAAALALVTWLYNAKWLGLMPQQHTAEWLTLLVAYPLLSIVPQAVLYRAFFMHRYRPLFPNARVMIVVSAALFGFGHIIFGNWLVVLATFAVGLLFGYRYYVSRSLAVSVLEHALYGNWIYTVGIGAFFSQSLAVFFQ